MFTGDETTQEETEDAAPSEGAYIFKPDWRTPLP
jgi:hypothetical protein